MWHIYAIEISFSCPADVNECVTGDAQCHPVAYCLNKPGSFECVCRPGYSGDGVNQCLGEFVDKVITCICDFNDLLEHAVWGDGPFKCYVTLMGVGGCQLFWEKAL